MYPKMYYIILCFTCKGTKRTLGYPPVTEKIQFIPFFLTVYSSHTKHPKQSMHIPETLHMNSIFKHTSNTFHIKCSHPTPHTLLIPLYTLYPVYTLSRLEKVTHWWWQHYIEQCTELFTWQSTGPVRCNALLVHSGKRLLHEGRHQEHNTLTNINTLKSAQQDTWHNHFFLTLEESGPLSKSGFLSFDFY